MSSIKLSNEDLTLVANTIRILSAEGVEKANSGHPGMPMGMADLAAVLWTKYLKFNPSDPKWISRDRFVLSNGHGSMLLYSLLHLAGYKVTLDDLKSFRQWGSITPGHPESFMTEGVECTTGPLGQGISNAVGLAIAQKLISSRYDNETSSLFSHNVFIFAGDGCLMEGVSSEASSVAGHLGLGNMIAIYDDNHITIAGDTKLAFTEDVCKRYEAYGWHVQRIDGHNYQEIDQAIANAVAEKNKPSLIAARTFIGKGSPNKANSHDVHGSPLGKDELALTKKNLNWPAEPSFYIPEETKKIFASRVEELKKEYNSWQEKFSAWKSQHPEKAKAFDMQMKKEVPADLEDKLVAALPKDDVAISTRKLSQVVLQALSANMNSLIGGSADLEPSTFTLINKSSDVEKNAFSGLNLRFGVREHGMGAIMNGLSYYGGFLPYGSTFLCFADYMRPTIRLAALSHLSGLFIFTHDSVFLGEDGPTHQPIEHLSSLRMIPNVHVFRPADGLETAICYSVAAQMKKGPAVMSFCRQNLPQLERSSDFNRKMITKGAYTLYENNKGSKPDIVIIATGSEVALAVNSAKKLSTNKSIRVVSMPCCELYRSQDASWKEELLPKSAKKVVIEAATSYGWSSIVDVAPDDVLYVTIDHFGASAPAGVLAEKFGLTEANVVKSITERFL